MTLQFFVCRLTPQNTLLLMSGGQWFKPGVEPRVRDYGKSWHATLWHTDYRQAATHDTLKIASFVAASVGRGAFVLNADVCEDGYSSDGISIEKELELSLCHHWLTTGDRYGSAIMTEDGYFLAYSHALDAWTNGDFVFDRNDLRLMIEDGASFRFWDDLSEVDPAIYQFNDYIKQLLRINKFVIAIAS